MNEKLDGYISIKDVKENVFKNYEKGIHCPVCRQYIKLYKRKITSSMAYALILIYRYFKNNPEEKWLHVEDYFKKITIPPTIRGDFPKLRYWALIEKKKGQKEDSNPDVGYYAITDKGKEFVKREIKVPRYIYIYNANVEKIGEEKINIESALGNKFRYDELMGMKK